MVVPAGGRARRDLLDVSSRRMPPRRPRHDSRQGRASTEIERRDRTDRPDRAAADRAPQPQARDARDPCRHAPPLSVTLRWPGRAWRRVAAASTGLVSRCADAVLTRPWLRAHRSQAAFGWFAAAGELGHRTARERVLSAYLAPASSAYLAPVSAAYLAPADAVRDAEASAEAGAWGMWMRERYLSTAGRQRPSQWH